MHQSASKFLVCFAILVASSSNTGCQSQPVVASTANGELANSGLPSASPPWLRNKDEQRVNSAPNSVTTFILYGNTRPLSSSGGDSKLSTIKRAGTSYGLDILSGGGFGKRSTGDNMLSDLFAGKRGGTSGYLDPLLGGSFAGKRSSPLDPLLLGSMGKRAGMINYEPIYGRRFGPLNSMPRVFEMRTTPFVDQQDQSEGDYE